MRSQPVSRRRSLAAICVALLLGSTSWARAQAPDSAGLPHFEFVQVVPDVYVAYQPSIDGLLHGNQTFVINDSDVFVFDANFTPAASRATIAMLKTITSKPVRTIAYSHWHNDHVWGTQALLEAYPGPINLIATDSTRDDILHEDQEKHREVAGFYTTLLAAYDSALASGIDPGTKRPFTPEERGKAVAVSASLRRYMVPQSDSITYHLPTISFARRMTLYDGSREIDLYCFGRGNTRGDGVVFLPKEHVVMTGDLLVYPVPFAFEAYLTDWIASLHAVRALGATHIIPGHGAPQSDYAYLDLVTRFLTAMRDETRRAVRAGLTLDAATKRIDLAPWHRAFAHGDDAIGKMFDAYGPAAIASGYAEAERAAKAARAKPGR
jgi:glyoxylase-like metal-dependent hydrolase (beta-lactamase superfamily II)